MDSVVIPGDDGDDDNKENSQITDDSLLLICSVEQERTHLNLGDNRNSYVCYTFY